MSVDREDLYKRALDEFIVKRIGASKAYELYGITLGADIL